MKGKRTKKKKNTKKNTKKRISSNSSSKNKKPIQKDVKKETSNNNLDESIKLEQKDEIIKKEEVKKETSIKEEAKIETIQSKDNSIHHKKSVNKRIRSFKVAKPNFVNVKRLDVAIFAMIILVAVTLAVLGLTGAKYKSEFTENNSAQVAKWNVSVLPTSVSNTLNVVSGNTTQDYIIDVTSTSEVSSKYSIVLENVPDTVTARLDGGELKTPDTSTKKIIFNDVGVINVSDETKTRTHTLTFGASVSSDAINNNNINIKVEFRQID